MNKISCTKLGKLIDEPKNSEVITLKTASGEIVDIEVKRFISLDEMDAFVNSVADAVFVNGEYKPALRNAVFFKALVAYFTSIKVDGLNNDRLLKLKYSLMRHIEKVVDQNLLCELETAVDSRIDFTIKCALSEQRRQLDEAISALNTEKDMILSQMEAVLDVFKRIAESTDELDKEQLQDDIHALANMNERDRINAIIDKKQADENESKG